MAVKRVTLPEFGTVAFYKRKGVKVIKLSVTHEGEVRVTLPLWVPFKMGIAFVNTNRDWINKHTPSTIEFIKDGDRIGKAHVIKFINDASLTQIKTKIKNNEINIFMPNTMTVEEFQVQDRAKKVAMKALRAEAEKLLPQRLADLASQHGFKYRDVRIKQLKSRWGSCNNYGDITLNFFLMQLPWDLIDYVLLHELTHTKVLAHGSRFWNELKKILPNVATYRKTIHNYKPVVAKTNLV